MSLVLQIDEPEYLRLVTRKSFASEGKVTAEELVTTTGTLEAVRHGIIEGNAHPVTFAPVVLTLVHRSSQYAFHGQPILYFRHYDINSREPEECPLCAEGSERLRPKENWAELTA